MPDVTVFERGPYVSAAFFCDQVLEEKNGVLTVVRIIDAVNIQAVGPGAPERIPDNQVARATMVISLKSGEARGAFQVTITPELPSGRREAPIETTVQLGGGGTGFQLVIPTEWGIEETGLHWFDVALDGALLTRIPLDIRYGRVVVPQGPTNQ